MLEEQGIFTTKSSVENKWRKGLVLLRGKRITLSVCPF